jgi:hypothetical protein
MMYFRRLHDTVALIICSLVPRATKTLYGKLESENLSEQDKPENISHGPPKIPLDLSYPECTAREECPVRLFFPAVSPVAAPFILFRLKRSGFSGCRVMVTDGGLLVTSSR